MVKWSEAPCLGVRVWPSVPVTKLEAGKLSNPGYSRQTVTEVIV